MLGLTTSTMDMGDGPYTLFEADGQMVGGTTPPYAPGTPNHWHVYFGVDDADATAAKAAELGGSILAPPFDSPVGRMAVIADPQGAVFSIIKASAAARLAVAAVGSLRWRYPSPARTTSSSSGR